MENSITLEKVSKSFHKKEIIHDISLNIRKSHIFGLLGPSGCGKTTTVKMMAGILNADKGKVFINSTERPNLSTMKEIGYMAQSAALYPTLSGKENLEFFGKLYGLSKSELEIRVEEMATLVGLTKELRKAVYAYSGGMKQRLSLAIALLPSPRVLILDEPTVGIDPVLRGEIWARLRELADEGVTILITTHVMDEAMKCDELALMREGRVTAQGSPDQLIELANATCLEEAFIYFGGDENEN